jgi:YidC/Oxa1 family membrane protein insertase
MRQNRFLLFVGCCILFFVIWMEVRMRLWPPPKPTPKDQNAAAEKDKDKDKDKDGEKGKEPEPKGGVWTQLAEQIQATPPAAQLVVAPEATPADKLTTLGDESPRSHFHLRVLLDPRGAGVRSVLLNKFHAQNLITEREENRPLELIPEDANRQFASFVLYHFDVRDSSELSPLDTLGRVTWDVVKGDDGEAIETTTLPDGRKRQSVSFRTTIQGVQITKTFSLAERDYHLGLEVKLLLKSRPTDGKALKFRYQLAGGHGLPIEGRWYTSTFRNALIALCEKDRNTISERDLQDLRQISHWQGGKEIEVPKDRKLFLRYAGVAVQYFASMIVVDNDQAKQDFLARARPTLEQYVTRGVIKSVAPGGESFVVVPTAGPEITFVKADVTEEYVPVRVGQHVSVLGYNDTRGTAVAMRIDQELRQQPLWEDDITVRVATDLMELEPGKEVTHRYLLYNGPVKPMLLSYMKDQPDEPAAVPPEVVDRYLYKLELNTMTDWHSQSWIGSFASTIGWTRLLIWCTNLMHWVLNLLHGLIGNYGLCIICLTLLVRAALFPLSRKQAFMSLKMQELAPELRKLQEKHKGDRQAMGMAQMELYRKHGINPFGTCWLLLLQMPIFMGLYFALQESIFFRLAPFWPTWIHNLAAPDMMFSWGDRIPWLSRPEDYGGFFYLGPYFNLLPVVAVILMVVQQKMLTPPPTDEQQEMQQKIMKYMMIFFGILFYKWASGLAVYFIASSLWGLAERKWLPKWKPGSVVRPGEALATATGPTVPPPAGSTAVTDRGERRRPGRQNVKRTTGRRGEPEESVTNPEATGPFGKLRNWWRVRKQRFREWWEEVLRNAEKK